MFRLWVVVLCLVGLSATAVAQESRVFLRFEGDQKTVDELEKARARFDSAVLKKSQVEFAGTTEMDSMFAECREQMGVSVSVDRECRLQAARRISVEHILKISAQLLEKGRYELVLNVWKPDSNGKIYSETVEVEAKSVSAAARVGFPTLADSYSCWRGVTEACAEGRTPGAEATVAEDVVEETADTVPIEKAHELEEAHDETAMVAEQPIEPIEEAVPIDEPQDSILTSPWFWVGGGVLLAGIVTVVVVTTSTGNTVAATNTTAGALESALFRF